MRFTKLEMKSSGNTHVYERPAVYLENSHKMQMPRTKRQILKLSINYTV